MDVVDQITIMMDLLKIVDQAEGNNGGEGSGCTEGGTIYRKVPELPATKFEEATPAWGFLLLCLWQGHTSARMQAYMMQRNIQFARKLDMLGRGGRRAGTIHAYALTFRAQALHYPSARAS